MALLIIAVALTATTLQLPMPEVAHTRPFVELGKLMSRPWRFPIFPRLQSGGSLRARCDLTSDEDAEERVDDGHAGAADADTHFDGR